MPKAYVRAITEVKTFGKKKEEAKEKAIDSDTRISPFGANITVVKNMEIKVNKAVVVCTFICIVMVLYLIGTFFTEMQTKEKYIQMMYPNEDTEMIEICLLGWADAEKKKLVDCPDNNCTGYFARAWTVSEVVK